MTKAVDPFVARVATEYGEDLVRFLARRVRRAVDARDLAQEAYVRLLRLDRKDLVRDPQPYVYRVAVNLLHEFELKRRADVDGLRRWTQEQDIHGGALAVDREVEARAIREQLTKVLEELTPKCRAVLILHRRDGMTYDEIGERIGISPSMVKKYLAIGLRHCRSRLRDLR
ncbi:MAG: sigma-70 family RNA polymerase sigma factor [Gammaproteobacteria bacterium]